MPAASGAAGCCQLQKWGSAGSSGELVPTHRSQQCRIEVRMLRAAGRLINNILEGTGRWAGCGQVAQGRGRLQSGREELQGAHGGQRLNGILRVRSARRAADPRNCCTRPHWTFRKLKSASDGEKGLGIDQIIQFCLKYDNCVALRNKRQREKGAAGRGDGSTVNFIAIAGCKL